MNIMDLEIRVTNEETYTRILQAETKYFSVIYSFLTKSQIRGKALEAMGIVHITEKLPVVSKLLPFTYKRKIKEPKEKWICHHINKTFQPVKTLSEKLSCIKKKTGLLPSPENKKHKANKILNDRNVYETFEKVAFNNESSSEKNPNNESSDGLLKILDADIEMMIENSTPPKLSESQAKIMWPFQSLNTLPKKSSATQKCHQTTTKRILKHSQSTKIISIDKDNIVIKKQKIINVRENEIIENINEKALAVINKENYFKETNIGQVAKNIGRKPDLDISKHNTVIDNLHLEKAGFLTEIFTPATKKGYFPENLIPIIIQSSTSSQDNSL